MKFVCEIKLSKKWWVKHQNEGKRNLKGGWGNDIMLKFEKIKPEGCHCSLRVKSNRVVSASSRKIGSSDAFTGEFECVSTSCGRTYKAILREHPDPDANCVVLRIFGSGESNHTKENPIRAQIRGFGNRKRLAQDVEKSRAKVLKRKLLARKVSTGKGRDDLDSGNYTGVPTSGALRNLAYEDRKQNRLDDNAWLNLSKNSAAVNEKYGEGSVFLLSEVPLKVAWATKTQLLHIADEAAFQKILGAFLDSTGSEAKPAPFDVNKM